MSEVLLWLCFISIEAFFSLVNEPGWLLLFDNMVLIHVRCSVIAVCLHLLRSLGRWNVEYVSFEHTVMSSSCGLLFLSRHAVCAAAAPNKNTDSVVLGRVDDSSGPICLR